MFDLKPHRIFNYETPLIAKNFRALLTDDDGSPIVFTGTNSAGDKVIGSSVDENYRRGFARYFHAIVNNDVFFDYFGGKKTLRSIYEAASPLYVVDKPFKNGKSKIFHYAFSEIPEEYKPSERSFIPSEAYEPSNIFTVPISGGIADQNRANPEDASEASTRIASLLDAGLKTLERYAHVVAETFSKPATEGSYEINFEVSLQEYPELFITPEECWDYLNAYLTYCVEDLADEVSSLDSPNAVHVKFERLTQKAAGLARKLGDRGTLDSDIEKSVLTDVLESPRLLRDIASIVRHNYSSLRIANNEVSLGKIDTEYAKTIERVAAQAAQIRKPTLTDSTIRDFKIHVYDFNKNTGGGYAYLQEPDGSQPVIRFSITGYDPTISAHKFTGSEHHGTVIPVRGKMLTVSGIPKKLTIQQE